MFVLLLSLATAWTGPLPFAPAATSPYVTHHAAPAAQLPIVVAPDVPVLEEVPAAPAMPVQIVQGFAPAAGTTPLARPVVEPSGASVVALLAVAGVSAAAGAAVANRYVHRAPRAAAPRMYAGAARPVQRIAARPAASRGGCVEMYWHIYPRDFSDSNFHDADRRRPSRNGTPGSVLNKEYNLEPGRHQALGKNDITCPSATMVDFEQCVVQVAEDGSCCYVWAQGVQPTGWRTRPDEPWNWMQPGESTVLQSGWKISLDYQSPESAVYKFEKAGRFAEPMGGGFQQPPIATPVGAGYGQEPIYAQPAGYGGDAGYGQPGAGYPPPQQGGYPQQGGW